MTMALFLALACHGLGGASEGPAAFDAAAFDSLVNDGIRRGAYPGAALVIGLPDTLVFVKGYGRLTWSPASAQVVPDVTLYDLASLTKVIATTTSVMLLVEGGEVKLDTPITTYVPELAGQGRSGITVRDLLTHSSGLPDAPPIYRTTRDRAEALRAVLAVRPVVPPGTRVIYSDLNAILLGEMVQRVSGESLDRFVAHHVLAPLGMTHTMFRPPPALKGDIAPTGMRQGRLIVGEVDDRNAARLGGAAGHAGLFSSAADVARFAQFMLRQGRLPHGRRLLKARTVRLFTAKAVDFGNGSEARTLGWQAIPTGEDVSSSGVLFGERSYGHTGWTGTSLWIDPDRKLFVVLLTNRVFEPKTDRSLTVLKTVRGNLADAAARAFDAWPAGRRNMSTQ